MAFEAVMTLPHRIIQRAMFMTIEFYHFGTATSLATSYSWDSHAVLVAIRRAFYISRELPLNGFIKINFDDSVRE